MTDIKYKHTVNFIGRNGLFLQSGIAITPTTQRSPKPQIVTLQPFTSKGMIGNCMMEIPLDDIPSVIAALQSYAKPQTV